MTMSVGLGKIQNDPNGSIMLRKALGALSEPGLLVYDDALTIDDTGRIVLRLKDGGGLQKDETGLSLSPVEEATSITTIGIDSEVDPRSEAYDREWNARLTGPAPNYFEGSLAVGAETLAGESTAAEALGISIEDAKVNITSITPQLRLSYDVEKYLTASVDKEGYAEISVVSPNNPGLAINTGDGVDSSGGVRINNGLTIESILMFTANFVLSGAAGIALDYKVLWTQSFTIAARPNQDHVTVCIGNGTTGVPDGNIVSYRAQITALNKVTINLLTIGPVANVTLPFFVLIHKCGTEIQSSSAVSSPATAWVYI